MITTSTGAKKIEGTDNWRLIFGAHNDTVDVYDAKLVNMTGATVSGNGRAGFVPAPSSEEVQKFLRGDGTWAVPNLDMVGATSSTSGERGLVPRPPAGYEGRFLRGDGSWANPAQMVGATSSANGVAGFVPIPLSSERTKYLRGDGTWATPTNTTYSDMVGATSSAAGTHGLVPAPASGNRAQFLRGDGTWATPTNTTYSDMTGASSSAAGTHGLVPAPAKGKQSSYLRGDGTWATPSNTWRAYQFKSYSFAYTIASTGTKSISGSDLGMSTPSGYFPAAVLQVLSGNISVMVTGFRGNQTGSEWVINLRNTSTGSVNATAYIQVLYLKSD